MTKILSGTLVKLSEEGSLYKPFICSPSWMSCLSKGDPDSDSVWLPSPHQSASSLLIPHQASSTCTRIFSFLATLPLYLSKSFLPLWLFCSHPIHLHFKMCLNFTAIQYFSPVTLVFMSVYVDQWLPFVSNILQFSSQLYLVWGLNCSRACNKGIAQYNAKEALLSISSSVCNLGQCIWSLWTVISSWERWKAIQL